MEQDNLIQIQTYLKAISELNSVFTGSDAWYMLRFGVLTKKENLFISKKISLFDDSYQKFYTINNGCEKCFIGDMVKVKNWEEQLTRTCNDWFYRGAYALNTRIALNENPELRDFKDTNNKVKNIIENRWFINKFCARSQSGSVNW